MSLFVTKTGVLQDQSMVRTNLDETTTGVGMILGQKTGLPYAIWSPLGIRVRDKITSDDHKNR